MRHPHDERTKNMGKNKLQKFADLRGFRHVVEYPFAALQQTPPDWAGRWSERLFGNDHPIVLELGCGRGEYTVELARLFPEVNFIGVDIKGARLWTGATQVLDLGLKNAAFLRTEIEFIDRFFAPSEVSALWLTFSDPQMKKPGKRLTSTAFLARYRRFLADGGLVHVKTDSLFLYTYTRLLLEANQIAPRLATDNLYALLPTLPSEAERRVLSIRTYYEQQWIDRGLPIKYLSFALPAQGPLVEPEAEIELDSYRSYNRHKRSALTHAK